MLLFVVFVDEELSDLGVLLGALVPLDVVLPGQDRERVDVEAGVEDAVSGGQDVESVQDGATANMIPGEVLLLKNESKKGWFKTKTFSSRPFGFRPRSDFRHPRWIGSGSLGGRLARETLPGSIPLRPRCARRRNRGSRCDDSRMSEPLGTRSSESNT